MILVRELARHLNGLLVMTSWFECPDIAHFSRKCAATVRISPLSSEDGRQLLDRMAVRADPQQTQALVERCDGHALGLRTCSPGLLAAWGAMFRVCWVIAWTKPTGIEERTGRNCPGLRRVLETAGPRGAAHHRDVLGRAAARRSLAGSDPGSRRGGSLWGVPQIAVRFRSRSPCSGMEELGLLNRRQGEGGVPLVDLHPLVRQHYALPRRLNRACGLDTGACATAAAAWRIGPGTRPPVGIRLRRGCERDCGRIVR